MKKNIFLLLLLTSFTTMFGQNTALNLTVYTQSFQYLDGATVVVNGITRTTDQYGGVVFPTTDGLQANATYSYTVDKGTCFTFASTLTMGTSTTYEYAILTNDGNPASNFSVLTNENGSPTLVNSARMVNSDTGNTYDAYPSMGNASFTNLPYGNYTLTVKKNCNPDQTVSNIEINCATLTAAQPSGLSTVVNFSSANQSTSGYVIGSIKQAVGDWQLVYDSSATAVLTTNPGGVQVGSVEYQQPQYSNNEGQFLFPNVPFGDYTMTVTRPCYGQESKPVTINCSTMNNVNGILGVEVEVYMPNSASTPASNYLVITKQGVGNVIVDSATLTDSNYNTIYGDLSTEGFASFTNVPYGSYTLLVKRNCWQDKVYSNVVINCATLSAAAAGPDGILYTAINYTNADKKTTNTVTINPYQEAIWQTSLGSTVKITSTSPAYTATLTTSSSGWANPLVFTNVPYSTNYTYTVTTPCRETVSGTFSVDCNSDQTYRINVPISTINNCTTSVILPSQDGQTLSTIDSFVYSTIVRNAVSYTWEVTTLDEMGNPVGNPQTKTTLLRNLKLTQLPNFAYNTQYRIRVAVMLGSDLQNFGPEATVSTPNASSVLLNNVCGSTPSLSSTITSSIVRYTPGYRYTLVNSEAPFDSHSIETLLRSFRLNQLTGLIPGASYNVTVEVKNTASSGGAYLPVVPSTCSIRVPEATGKFSNSNITTVNSEFDAFTYPNPFAEQFVINLNSINQGDVTVKVYDMVGRLVEQRNANVSELVTTQIGNNYQTGVYNVIVSQGSNVKSLRVIKR